MVYVSSYHRDDVHEAFYWEGLRRLYAYSVDQYGHPQILDYLLANAKKDAEGRLDIEYRHYYCPMEVQRQILNDLLKEPYKAEGKKPRILSEHERSSLYCGITLGASPHSAIETFLKHHPDHDKKLEKLL